MPTEIYCNKRLHLLPRTKVSQIVTHVTYSYTSEEIKRNIVFIVTRKEVKSSLESI